MKVTRKTREQAALLCAVGASQPTEFYDQMARDLGVSPAALRLATDAFLTALRERMKRPGSWRGGDVDAEAEAMLRTGWTP